MASHSHPYYILSQRPHKPVSAPKAWETPDCPYQIFPQSLQAGRLSRNTTFLPAGHTALSKPLPKYSAGGRSPWSGGSKYLPEPAVPRETQMSCCLESRNSTQTTALPGSKHPMHTFHKSVSITLLNTVVGWHHLIPPSHITMLLPLRRMNRFTCLIHRNLFTPFTLRPSLPLDQPDEPAHTAATSTAAGQGGTGTAGASLPLLQLGCNTEILLP